MLNFVGEANVISINGMTQGSCLHSLKYLGNFIWRFVEHMMHPTMPLGLNHSCIWIVNIRKFNPTVLPVRLIQVFVIFVPELVSAFKCSKF